MRGTSITLAFVLATFVFVACGGSGGGGGSSPDAKLAVLGSGTSSSHFSSLSLTVTAITLIDHTGKETGNLLDQPIDLEVLHLSDRQALLGRAPLPVGSFAEVHVTIDPTTVRARDRAGNPAVVPVARDQAVAAFASPIQVGSDRAANVRVAVLADRSLQQDQDGWHFALEISVDDPSGVLVLDDLLGRVTSVDPSASRFSMDVLSSEDDATAIATVDVVTDPASVLLREDGERFASASDFWGAVSTGSCVQVHGKLRADGGLSAASVDLMSHDHVAAIEGTVMTIDKAARVLELRIKEIDEGERRVRHRIGKNPSILVAWDAGTGFVRHDEQGEDQGGDNGGQDDGGDQGGDNGQQDNGGDQGGDNGGEDNGGDQGGDNGGQDNGGDQSGQHGPATEGDLAVGQQLKVLFTVFDSSPFPAASMIIEAAEPRVSGTTFDVSLLPGALIVHLDADDPAVVSGLVASPDTDVLVNVTNAKAMLEVDDRVEIRWASVLPAVGIELDGMISGPPAAPTLDAIRARVTAGELRGLLTSIDGAAHTAVIDIGKIEESFGTPPLPDPVTATFARSATFEGDATSERELVQLFLGLRSGEQVAIEAAGLGDGAGGVKLFEVTATLIRGK